MPSAPVGRFPPQVKYIVASEACERFSYYGMRAILVVYMVRHLGMAAPDATAAYHLFVSASYLFALLGGWLSDRRWGKYRTILILSLGYCLGHGTLALEGGRAGLALGLLLVALGAGGVKPTVSAFVGDQFTSSNKRLIVRVFDVFYFAINVGSLAATLLIPWVLPRWGASWAFGLPGILMALATLALWAGRRGYRRVPPSRAAGAGFFAVLWTALRGPSGKGRGGSFLDAARARHSAEEVEGAKAVWSLLKLYAAVSVFWALYDQYGSSWVLQAEQMDLRVFGSAIEAPQIQSVNSLLLLLLIPVCSLYLYPWFERATGVTLTPLRRMGGGMAMASLSFVCAAALQAVINRGARPWFAWQLIQYGLLTLAEIMVSITGLEFSYTQAPRAMKSTIMSLWLLTIFAGNLLTAWIAEIRLFEAGSPAFYLFFAGLMAAVTVLFAALAARHTVREYLEAENSA